MGLKEDQQSPEGHPVPLRSQGSSAPKAPPALRARGMEDLPYAGLTLATITSAQDNPSLWVFAGISAQGWLQAKLLGSFQESSPVQTVYLPGYSPLDSGLLTNPC